MSIHSGQTILDCLDQLIHSRIKKKSRGIHHHYQQLINGYEAKIAELSKKIFLMTCLFSEPSDPTLPPVPEENLELRERELERELRETERRERELRETERRERELKETERRERELRETERRERELKETERRERELRETERRERELRETEQRERELRETEQRERELKEPEIRERELRELELRKRELREREEHDFICELREFYESEKRARDQRNEREPNPLNWEQNDVVLIEHSPIDLEEIFGNQKEMQRIANNLGLPPIDYNDLCEDPAEPIMQRKPTKKKPKKTHRRYQRK